jgi:myo-inositol 2-dehydrogenase/D-chiro-inositol 1-dehydrogenase
MTDVLRIGLIGAGRIGQVHASNVFRRMPRADLGAVADVNEAAAFALGEKYHAPMAVGDYRDILKQPSIDAVLICSATHTHAQIIEEAAQAGKHIFCEKPIALNLADIDRALRAVDDAKVKLQIGFNRRFDANFRRVRRAIEQGEIGQPHIIHLVSRDPAPPPIDYIKVSGGLFLDMAIHDFDMARYLICDEIESVFAVGGVKVDPAIGEAGDIDTAVTMLRFANGVIGTIDNSRQAVYGYDQRVEVFGSGGAVSVENNFPNNTIISDSASVRRDLPLNFFMQRYTESYATELEAFIDAILHDAPVPVSGRDGRIAVVVGMAARRSFVERRPVNVSEIN